MYRAVHVCTAPVALCSMSKKSGGFRLDLGEPLATRLSEFCETNFRNKTQLIREVLKAYLDSHERKRDETEKPRKRSNKQ